MTTTPLTEHNSGTKSNVIFIFKYLKSENLDKITSIDSCKIIFPLSMTINSSQTDEISSIS